MQKRSAPGTSRSEYELLSKEQLIDRLLSLQSPSSNAKSEKALRPMNWSKYSFQKLAFQLLYLGWNYHGVACQSADLEAGIPTVEREFFKACLKTRLFLNDSIEEAEFSRCGRTDAGVSAFSQVLAVKVRTELADSKKPPLDYLRMLNGALPRDIRVLAYAAVPAQWNARFDCKWRAYRYLFFAPRKVLDMQAMKEAGARLVGEHDFRNFCRRDPTKPRETFIRRVLEFDLQLVQEAVLNGPWSLVQVQIKGSAFLLNQVRCIIGVSYHVASGVVAPEIIDDLLQGKGEKPGYEVASEYPLMLFDAGYAPELEWQRAYCLNKEFLGPLVEQLHEFGAKFSLCHEMLKLLGVGGGEEVEAEALVCYKQPFQGKCKWNVERK